MPKNSLAKKQNILVRKEIPGDPYAYVYRRVDRNNRWFLYYLDSDKGNKHRFTLKNPDGTYPLPTKGGQEEAWMLGVAKFIELKAKTDRGEEIKALTFGSMVHQFLDKEKRRISSIPQEGITKESYRLIDTQCRWIRDYINDDKKEIHKLRKNTFMNYETWRKERAVQFNKPIPKQTTITAEMSCLRRMFKQIAVDNNFIHQDNVPSIPSIKQSKDKKHRRDDFVVGGITTSHAAF